MALPLAVRLAHARIALESLDADTVSLPSTATEAYEVQDALISLIDAPVVGWKIGATSDAAQSLLGVKAPIAGPVFATTLIENGTTVDQAAYHHDPGVECEFVMRIGSSVTPGSRHDATSARKVVNGVAPGIELVGTRFGALAVPPALLVADGSAHCGLTVGDMMEPERAGDLTTTPLRCLVDGEERATGTGDAVLGDPYNALAWLLNHLGGRGIALEAGAIVTTGTCTGIIASEPGTHVVNDAAQLGRVSVRFS